MIGLSVNTDVSADYDLLGKVVDDLQEDIAIEDGAITGTLKYVTGYTGFSGEAELQSGNYLVLHCDCPGADEIVVELVGGSSGPVTLDADGIIVMAIGSNEQTVKVTAKKEGFTNVSKTFTLTDVTLKEEDDD